MVQFGRRLHERDTCRRRLLPSSSALTTIQTDLSCPASRSYLNPPANPACRQTLFRSRKCSQATPRTTQRSTHDVLAGADGATRLWTHSLSGDSTYTRGLCVPPPFLPFPVAQISRVHQRALAASPRERTHELHSRTNFGHEPDPLVQSQEGLCLARKPSRPRICPLCPLRQRTLQSQALSRAQALLGRRAHPLRKQSPRCRYATATAAFATPSVSDTRLSRVAGLSNSTLPAPCRACPASATRFQPVQHTVPHTQGLQSRKR